MILILAQTMPFSTHFAWITGSTDLSPLYITDFRCLVARWHGFFRRNRFHKVDVWRDLPSVQLDLKCDIIRERLVTSVSLRSTFQKASSVLRVVLARRDLICTSEARLAIRQFPFKDRSRLGTWRCHDHIARQSIELLDAFKAILLLDSFLADQIILMPPRLQYVHMHPWACFKVLDWSVNLGGLGQTSTIRDEPCWEPLLINVVCCSVFHF